MRRYWMTLVLLFVLMVPLPARSAAVGTVTMTSNNLGPIMVYTLSWTSTDGGAVSGNPKSVVSGWIQSVEFIPDAGGTQPSNLYDATLKNTWGADLLEGVAIDLSNTISVPHQFTTPYYFPGSGDLQTLDLGITNAGNAKTGKVKIYVERR